jgi:hypothetical protein
MNSPPSWLLPIALSAVLFGCGCSRSQPIESREALDVAPPFSAEKWLKWDRSLRMAFIVAYLVGRWDGVSAGCSDGRVARPINPKTTLGALPSVFEGGAFDFAIFPSSLLC